MSGLKLSDYFSKTEHQRAGKLIDQQERYLNLAKIELGGGDFSKAGLYSNYATAIAVELNRMHQDKLMTDEAVQVIKQAKKREITDQMLQRRRDWF